MAQEASAPAWGAGGRPFKSGRPDHFFLELFSYIMSHPRGIFLLKKGGLNLAKLRRKSTKGQNKLQSYLSF